MENGGLPLSNWPLKHLRVLFTSESKIAVVKGRMNLKTRLLPVDLHLDSHQMMRSGIQTGSERSQLRSEICQDVFWMPSSGSFLGMSN